VPPGEKPLRLSEAQKLPADKIGQDLAGEELCQSQVVEPQDLTEHARAVLLALSHQKMEVRVKIDPVPKCRNDRNSAGRKHAPG